MKQKLQKELFEKYPKIFIQKDLPMIETAMCWGIDCGDGWYAILDKLCSSIQNHIDSAGINQIEAVQVKEKYGTLRFYTDGSDSTVDKFIREAEKNSEVTCENCGSFGKIEETKGWWRTRCNNCKQNNE